MRGAAAGGAAPARRLGCAFVAWAARAAASCLGDAVPGALRRNVTSLSGQSLPLTLVEFNWDSAQLALHVFRILAEERLGYHVAVTAPDYSRVSTALHVVAGCPGSDFCLAGAGSPEEGLSAGHLLFEVWPNGEEPLARYQAEFPDRAPDRLGDIGYSGREASFVRPQIFAEALTARGIHLSHYGSYNASWFRPSEYFDDFTALDLDRFATCASSLQNATLRAALGDYHRHFASDPSVYEQDGVLELACESDRWWLSPRCRGNASQCVPYIDYQGWGSKLAMQQATAHNMPLAIANARSLDDWRHVVTSHRVLTFWYTPDALFADLGLLVVDMPEYSPAEFAVGLKTTAPEAVKLYNFAAPDLRSTAPDAVALVERMAVDPGSIMGMLRWLALEGSTSPESYYNISCRWLRENEAVWAGWIPSKTDCIEGQGLVDLEGNFLPSPLGASGCEFCPPGSMSQRWNGTAERVCEPCSPGTFQDQPGKGICKWCESGKYSPVHGTVGCADCSVGTFAAGAGNVGCSPCPLGAAETTDIRGAGSRWDCLCESEHYRDAGHSESSGEYASCLPCPAGMVCKEGNQEPRLLGGFWAAGSSSADRAYSVYRCRDAYQCPGGAAGSCADGREGVGCANCMPGHHPTEEGRCSSCGSLSSLSLVACALIGLLGLVAMALLSQVDPARVTANHVTLGITVSNLFVTLQTMSIFSGMGVVSIEPYRTVLEWFQVISFKLELLQLSCVMADRNVVSKYVATLLIYPVCVAVMCLIFLVMKYLGRDAIFDHAFNAIGSLTMVLFLVLTITGLEPFYCITSPNGHATLASTPSVLCYQGDWVVLASFGAVAILVYGVAFFAAVVRVTLRYPYMIVSTQGGIAMSRYRFMFQRFTVESYFFTPVFLARSLFIALVPVVFADYSHRQVFALACGLLCFGSLFACWLPWRGSLPNLVDVTVNGCIIVLLVCSSLLLDVSEGTVLVDMHIFLGVPLAATLAIPLGAICYHLLRAFRSPHMYSAFLCHHKVGCGAGARLMQMDLELHLKGPVFLDSDNLENLEGLLDIVRCSVKNLVVLLTAKTLSRPWCAGEITTAFLNQVPMVPVAYDGYVDPKEADLSEDAIAADCLSLCAAQGMAPSSVKAAYVHLCALPKIQCLRLVGDASTEAMWRVVACCKRGAKTESPAHAAPPADTAPGSPRAGSAYVHLAIVVNHTDPEAVSGALVLSWLFRKHVQWNVVELLSPDSVEEMSGPERLLILLTEGCLTARLFAGTLLAAWTKWRAGARLLTTAASNFQYPSTQNLHSFIAPQVASMLSLPDGEVATIFEHLMDIIAVSFTACGRMSVLETEARNIVARLDVEEPLSPTHATHQRRRGSLGSHLSSDAGGVRRRDGSQGEVGELPTSLPTQLARPGGAVRAGLADDLG